jgi:hypothetical protein
MQRVCSTYKRERGPERTEEPTDLEKRMLEWKYEEKKKYSYALPVEIGTNY